MKQPYFLTALAALLLLRATPAARGADGSSFVDTGNPGDGLIGYHVYGTATSRRGFSLDYATTSSPGWSLGLEQTYGDLCLFNYNFVTGGTLTAANQTWFRMRGDTGQLTLGSGVGHAPDGWQQVAINAGTSTAPLDGLGIMAFGSHSQINLSQGNAGSNHTQINLASKWQIATDANQNGGLDLYLYDN